MLPFPEAAVAAAEIEEGSAATVIMARDATTAAAIAETGTVALAEMIAAEAVAIEVAAADMARAGKITALAGMIVVPGAMIVLRVRDRKIVAREGKIVPRAKKSPGGQRKPIRARLPKARNGTRSIRTA